MKNIVSPLCGWMVAMGLILGPVACAAHENVEAVYAVKVENSSSFCHVMGHDLAKSANGIRRDVLVNMSVNCLESISEKQTIVDKKDIMYAIPLRESSQFCLDVGSRFLHVSKKNDRAYIQGSNAYKNCMTRLSYENVITI